MAQDLFEHWYIKLAQFIFFRALAQIEGIVRQRVLWLQFLINLFYEVLSISFFFLPQQVSRIKIDFCGILLPSYGRCKAGKKPPALCFWSAILFYQRADCSARLLLSAYRWTPGEGQLYA